MAKRKPDYEVGYGKPPKGARFEKGRSGNPSGRPKGARSLQADFEAELKELVRIVESGRARDVTKQQVLVKSLFAKAVKGDVRALSKAFDLAMRFHSDPAAGEDPGAINADDQAIIADYLERFRRNEGG